MITPTSAEGTTLNFTSLYITFPQQCKIVWACSKIPSHLIQLICWIPHSGLSTTAMGKKKTKRGILNLFSQCALLNRSAVRVFNRSVSKLLLFLSKLRGKGTFVTLLIYSSGLTEDTTRKWLKPKSPTYLLRLFLLLTWGCFMLGSSDFLGLCFSF